MLVKPKLFNVNGGEGYEDQVLVGGNPTGISNLNQQRYVWNYYNRFEKMMAAYDPTDTWTYAVAAWRQARATATNQVDFVVGWNEDMYEADVQGVYNYISGTTAGAVGIGLDATNANSALTFAEGSSAAASYFTIIAKYKGFVGVGKHYFAIS